MAGTITLSALLRFVNAELSTSVNQYPTEQFPTASDLSISGEVLTSTTTTALPLGGLSAPGGWFYFQNNDSVNSIIIYSSTSGVPFLRLAPGAMAMGQFDPTVTAPATKATAGTPELQYFVAGA